MAMPVAELIQLIHQTMLLGTDRMGLPPQLEEELIRLGVDPDLSPEEKLLQGVAIAEQWEKAGWPLDKA